MYKFLLRLPDSLAQQVKDSAKDNGRSINAEILWRLRRSLEGYQR